MPGPSSLHFRLSASAQRIIADLTYVEIPEDGVIDAQEMEALGFTRDSFEAAGILPGQMISEDEALLFAVTHLAFKNAFEYGEMLTVGDHSVNRATIEKSILQYNQNADRYAKEGRGFSAFSSMMMAVKLSKNLEEEALSRSANPIADTQQAALSTKAALDFLLVDYSIDVSDKIEFVRVKTQWIKDNGVGKNPEIQFAFDFHTYTALNPDFSFALGLMENPSRFGDLSEYLLDYLQDYSFNITPTATPFESLGAESAVWIAEQIGDASFLPQVDLEYRKATLTLAAGLCQAGLSREKSVLLAKDFSVEVKGGRDSEVKIATMATLTRMGVDFDSAKEMTLSARTLAEQSHSTHTFSADSLNYTALQLWDKGVDDPADIKAILSVLNRYGLDGAILSICDKEQLLKFKTQGVVKAFLAITEHYTLDPKSYGDGTFAFPILAESLNRIHDRNVGLDKTDAMRREIASKMSPLMAYRLLAEGGESLYTSSYQKVVKGFSSKVGQDKIGTWLSKQDRRGEYINEFMLILARFDNLDLIKSGASEFIPVILSLLGDSSVIDMGQAARLVSIFSALFPKMSFAQKERMQAIFSRGISERHSKSEYAGSLAYMLRTVADKNNKDLPPALSKLAATLPALDNPKVPVDEWLKGETPTLTAKLYFYSDERWFGESVKHYLSKGFKREPKELIARGRKSSSTVTLMREQNHVQQKIILTNDPNDDRVASLNDPEIDIIVHRGHSYHLNKTFPTEIDLSPSSTKLIFGGSCGSYGDMSSSGFLATYGHHLLMSDSNTGEGAVNNAVLLAVFDGVSKGKTDWNDYRLQNFISKRGIKAPNDPSVLVGRYISDFMEWEPA